MLPFSHPSQRSKYRSARSVRPQNGGTNGGNNNSGPVRWTKSKLIFLCMAVLAVGSISVIPILVLEGSYTTTRQNNVNHLHPRKMLDLSKVIQEEAVQKQVVHVDVDSKAKPVVDQEELEVEKEEEEEPDLDFKDKVPAAENEALGGHGEPSSKLARGVNKLPLSQTRALMGARQGEFQCDADVDQERMIYWNSPQGDRDRSFKTPFAPPKNGEIKEYFLTFEPDRGGWNNIRMSMEILFVMAAATGRTLVLPPRLPLYLLGHGKEGARGFGDFFPLHNKELLKKVKIMTMREFVTQESPSWGLTDEQRNHLLETSDLCVHQDDSGIYCEDLNKELRSRGYQPHIYPQDNCYVFDENVLETGDPSQLSDEAHLAVDQFCGVRKPVFFDKKIQTPRWIHWDAACSYVKQEDREHCFRLLQHFYTFIHFTDPEIDNHYKRFVRDFLHYNDAVNCAAAKVIDAVQKDADKLGVPWSAWHVRRGDLQYKKVKISAEEWYENTKEVWRPGELLYMATDERNKAFFDPIKEKGHPVKFLDDYWDIGGIGDLDTTYIGMVDTIVAAQGRAFAGTWFSTFSGYINRLRGYLGKSMKYSWYSFLPRKESMRVYVYPEGNYPAREWPLGWLGIDSDEHITIEQGVEADDITSLRLALPTTKPKPDGKPVKLEKIDITMDDLHQDIGFEAYPVARLVAGRDMSETPAVKGAKRGDIKCDVNVNSLAYWNDPQGERDQNFKSPFAIEEGETKYISFAPDRGGWNNIRMSMEIIFVIAAATGRTLVLPPKAPLYLLSKDTKSRHRGFADFFPLDTPEFKKRLKIITMEEFIKREGGDDGRLKIPADQWDAVNGAAQVCDRRAKGGQCCDSLFNYLAEVGHSPHIRAHDDCVVFDVDAAAGTPLSLENQATVKRRCGDRAVTYWNKELQDPVLIHFRASEKEYRLLAHFYGMIFFTDPAVENYFKRFVRDFLHYHDSIYCAAGKIVKALQAEGRKRGFGSDKEGGGGYSAMHVRRGDLQYKKVKIPAEEWYQNTKEVWKPGELLYIATDERNKTFFDPIREHHDLRFLDDYFEMAGLKDLDPNYMGMIDTIVASRGRAFAGTWFSTFSGYINRMRGYHGMTMMDSWYSFLDRKEALHTWEEIDHFAYAFEWPDGWIGIDADIFPSRDKF